MRTTVTIRDEVYEAARLMAFQERRSLGDVLSDLAEQGLRSSANPAKRTLGVFEGEIVISEDFDDELGEFHESLDEAFDL